MTIDMSQFFQVFFDEAEEGLAEMEKLLLAVNVSDPDDEDLNAIFRAAHSIKGGSATFGLTDITEITHVLESLLDRIRQGQMALTSQHVDAFLAAKDILKSMLDGHRHGATVDLDAVADVRMLLQSLSEGASKKVATPQALVGPGGVSRYRIELPNLGEREIEALQQELGLLGTIEKADAEEGRCVFILDTAKGADSIHEICSFLVNADDLKISQAVAARSKEEEQGYGFFAPFVPANATDRERGYGFFEPFVPQGDAERAKQAEAAAHAETDEPPALAVTEGGVEKKAKGPATVHESSSIRVGIEKVDQL